MSSQPVSSFKATSKGSQRQIIRPSRWALTSHFNKWSTALITVLSPSPEPQFLSIAFLGSCRTTRAEEKQKRQHRKIKHHVRRRNRGKSKFLRPRPLMDKTYRVLGDRIHECRAAREMLDGRYACTDKVDHIVLGELGGRFANNISARLLVVGWSDLGGCF
jgi:hypothetical protein